MIIKEKIVLDSLKMLQEISRKIYNRLTHIHIT